MDPRHYTSEIRQQNTFYGLARQALDGLHGMFLGKRDQRDRAAFIPGTARAADTVNIILGYFRYIIVYHM
jgi:hypothetical protein